MRRLLTFLAFAVGFTVCTGIAGSAGDSELAPYVHPQQLVDVGGHKINIYCTGHGSPSVILDAGGGQTMLTWSKVQPAIAKFTRVCSYDRASMGFSGDGPLPRDANAIVTDLHTTLQRAHIAPPYVLVGHSSGGLYALLYANRYLHDVAGMVLVDPSFPNEAQAYYAVSPSMKRMNAAEVNDYKFCYQAAVHGKLNINRGSKAYAMCGFPPNAAAELKANCARKDSPSCKLAQLIFTRPLRPALWLALDSEDKAYGATDSAEVLKAQRGYGAMPLTVLTAADEMSGSPFPPAENRAIQRASNAGHIRLARLSSAGVHSVVPHAGHFIQIDQPAVVIAAVAKVVSQARR
ncbi:MAG TPA: alpha/beta hydrolase [Candidatus Elarobacter sp.]|nr:alpha/beta hydrolase [Candidatus Elarobacter sp.]